MSRYEVTVSAEIAAPADRIYAILADYTSETGHRAILPKRYFSDLQVEQGGHGAGTIVHFTMHAAGTTRVVRAQISEPEPGRVLVETDLDSGAVTTLSVAPLGEDQTAVKITTALESRRGLFAPLERLMTRLFLTRVYTEELALLATVAGRRAGGTLLSAG